MKLLVIIYLVYMFVSLYFLIFFLLLYLRNKKDIFSYPQPKKNYSVSFIVPAYNEEKTLENSIKHILEIDYDNIVEVIIVNDCSKDNTLKIAKKLAKKYKKVKVINNEKNLGKAGSLNKGIEISKGELIAVVDADSYPAKDSLKKMVGFFDDPKVGAVTCPVIPRNTNNFLEKLQEIEYKMISFGRKLLEYVDSIYVTPGPLAIYRREALLDIQGFDTKNITEDIEATWHITAKGWKRKMSFSTYVSTTVPSKFKIWFKQRRRWNIGGIQCILKYKKHIGKKDILGLFIIPFFIVGLILGILGLFVFLYVFITKLITRYFIIKYSMVGNAPLLTLEEFYITPSFLNYLGVIMFILGFIYTLIILSILKENVFKKDNILNIPFYLIVYLTIYPIILVDAVWHYYRKKISWR